MMKKISLFALLIFLLIIMVGCQPDKTNIINDVPDFMFSSLEWGADWETVQRNDMLQNADFEIKENGHRQTVTVKNVNYLGVDIDMVGLGFDVAELTETRGLCYVFLQFSEKNEESLLNALTDLYGERRSSYLDKNGVENGINPPGWVSEKTVEDVLTEEEKEFYVSFLSADADPSRIDAILRTPLASIRFDEKQNFVELNGNAAAVVKFVKKEREK